MTTYADYADEFWSTRAEEIRETRDAAFDPRYDARNSARPLLGRYAHAASCRCGCKGVAA